MKRVQFIAQAHPIRAIAEAYALGAFFLIVLLSLQTELAPVVVQQGLFFISAGVAVWTALRLRPPTGHWLRRILIELAPGLLASMPSVFFELIFRIQLLNPNWVGGFFLLVGVIGFLCFRAGVGVWLFWDRLRRRRLIWSITHAILTTVVMLALLFVVGQTLIDDLFALARAEVGQLTLHCQPIDLGALAQRVAETIAPLAWQTGRVQVAAEVQSGVLAIADEVRLAQVLRNLIHNGVRHTPPGGIVAVIVRPDRATAILEVRDTGEGIAPENVPHVWERFYRSEQTRNHDQAGAGLGLALVKELIEAMGGTVSVTSRLGEGSCFTVSLPVEQASPDAARGGVPDSTKL